MTPAKVKKVRGELTVTQCFKCKAELLTPVPSTAASAFAKCQSCGAEQRVFIVQSAKAREVRR